MLWYLDEAADPAAGLALRVELEAAYDEIERLTDQAPTDLLATDLPTHRDRVNVLLARVSALVRADSPPKGQVSGAGQAIRPGADLIGARLAGQDLRGANSGAPTSSAPTSAAPTCAAPT